jgi:hypothetical protein
MGFLNEDVNRSGFSITPQGELLRKDHPQTLRGVTLLEEGPEHYAIWKHLRAIIKDGKQNAFVREFGCNIFEHRDRNPDYAQVFNQAMSSYSSSQTTWALEAFDGYDFSNISHICDIGDWWRNWTSTCQFACKISTHERNCTRVRVSN